MKIQEILKKLEELKEIITYLQNEQEAHMEDKEDV